MRDEQGEEQRAFTVEATSASETDTVHAILALKSLLSLIKHEGVFKTKELLVKVMCAGGEIDIGSVAGF